MSIENKDYNEEKVEKTPDLKNIDAKELVKQLNQKEMLQNTPERIKQVNDYLKDLLGTDRITVGEVNDMMARCPCEQFGIYFDGKPVIDTGTILVKDTGDESRLLEKDFQNIFKKILSEKKEFMKQPIQKEFINFLESKNPLFKNPDATYTKILEAKQETIEALKPQINNYIKELLGNDFKVRIVETRSGPTLYVDTIDSDQGYIFIITPERNETTQTHGFSGEYIKNKIQESYKYYFKEKKKN